MQAVNRRIDPQGGIKILGERNSGTNFLETLLRQNVPGLALHDNIPTLPTRDSARHPEGFFPRRSQQAAEEALLDHYHEIMLATSGGWKHAAATPRLKERFLDPTGAAVIILLRHPADWVHSMHRNPFHALGHVPKAFPDFLRQPWLTVARDELGDRLLPDLPTLLARKAKSYLWLLDTWPNSTVIRYEDLAVAPEDTLRKLGLPLSDTFITPQTDPRGFARRNRHAASFEERAAQATHDRLDTPDRAFLRAGIAGELLETLYPS